MWRNLQVALGKDAATAGDDSDWLFIRHTYITSLIAVIMQQQLLGDVAHCILSLHQGHGLTVGDNVAAPSPVPEAGAGTRLEVGAILSHGLRRHTDFRAVHGEHLHSGRVLMWMVAKAHSKSALALPAEYPSPWAGHRSQAES